MKKKIKLFDPVIGKEELDVVSNTIKSRFWASGSGIGKVEKFENEFKKYINSQDCIAVNSGTAALNLALSLYNIKNMEVIIPSLTFVSTAHSVVINGAKPIFVDVNPKTLCIDPDKIRNVISKKTKIILPVHFAGMPCNLNEIQKICKENNLILIEDAAHASGALYQNKKIGTHGSFVCFSFHPVKNLAMPTGGMITINHSKHNKFRTELLAKRWCGITNRKNLEYDVKELGWNYYMNEISAAIGLVQLKKLNKLNQIRRKIAKKYNNELLTEAKMPYDNNCVYHFYWILVNNREKLRKKLHEYGLETGTHYKPVHTFSFYKTNYKLPISEEIGKKIITLPTHPNLTENDTDKIIKLINKFLV